MEEILGACLRTTAYLAVSRDHHKARVSLICRLACLAPGLMLARSKRQRFSLLCVLTTCLVVGFPLPRNGVPKPCMMPRLRRHYRNGVLGGTVLLSWLRRT